MKNVILPGIGDMRYYCGNCMRFYIIVREEDSMDERKATMAEHAKPCRKEKGGTPTHDGL